jgi:hypothetical protein
VPGDHFTSVDPAIRRSIAFFQQLGGASTPASQTAPSTSIAGSSIPNITPPSSPNIRQPDFPTIPTPSFPTPNFPSTPTIPTPTPHIPNIPNPAAPGFGGRRSATRSQAVVTFEIKAFNGRGPESFAARRSLVGIRWVNIADIRVDKPKGLIVVGVRGNSVSTAEAKKKLEENGFTIGSTSYRPSGLPD